MGVLVRQLVAAVATYGSLVALVYAVKLPSGAFTSWEKLLLAVATLVFVADIGFSVNDFVRRRELRYGSGKRQGSTNPELHVQMARPRRPSSNFYPGP